jgi:hypothetical protein
VHACHCFTSVVAFIAVRHSPPFLLNKLIDMIYDMSRGGVPESRGKVPEESRRSPGGVTESRGGVAEESRRSPVGVPESRGGVPEESRRSRGGVP